MTTHTDRRRSPRFDKAFPVFLSGDGGVSFGVARNIGEGGMYVETLNPEEPGSTVVVTFSWPGSTAEMSVEAEVRFVAAPQESSLDDASGIPRKTLHGLGLAFRRFLEQDLYEASEPQAAHPMGLH